ncbi:MAG TPA: hypothetical protein VGK67_03520 [Myxococcales bacterium]|jgi:hypothetical protein
MDISGVLKGAGAYSAYKYLKDRDWSGDFRQSMLDRFGLERRGSNTAAYIFGGLGFLALGVLVGSALGVIFAPMPGSEVRSTFKQQGVRGVVDRARASMPSAMPSA